MSSDPSSFIIYLPIIRKTAKHIVFGFKYLADWSVVDMNLCDPYGISLDESW